jgi:hypothetical protein
MLRSPLVLRLTAYGLLGMCCQLAFASLHAAFLAPGSAAPAAPEFWMFWIFGAGGLVLDGADELLRVPTPLRAACLVLCTYGLGYAVGWGLQQTGGDFPWDGTARGFTADGRMGLEEAPYWFALALCFRQIRHALDRIQATLVVAPVTAHRLAAGEAGAATAARQARPALFNGHEL